jgi:hypothetical protein
VAPFEVPLFDAVPVGDFVGAGATLSLSVASFACTASFAATFWYFSPSETITADPCESVCTSFEPGR